MLWRSASGEILVHITESGGQGVLRVGGDQTVTFVVRDRDASGGWIEIDGRSQRFYAHQNRHGVTVWLAGRTYHLVRVQKGHASDQARDTASGEVRALMPGKILRIPVTAGEEVTERQPLVIMESMKMETTLASPRAGKVSAVKCEAGQLVEMGELLVLVE